MILCNIIRFNAPKKTVREKAQIKMRMERFGDQLQTRSEPLQLAINTYAVSLSNGLVV